MLNTDNCVVNKFFIFIYLCAIEIFCFICGISKYIHVSVMIINDWVYVVVRLQLLLKDFPFHYIKKSATAEK